MKRPPASQAGRILTRTVANDAAPFYAEPVEPVEPAEPAEPVEPVEPENHFLSRVQRIDVFRIRHTV
jgi:hypothetical protein